MTQSIQEESWPRCFYPLLVFISLFLYFLVGGGVVLKCWTLILSTIQCVANAWGVPRTVFQVQLILSTVTNNDQHAERSRWRPVQQIQFYYFVFFFFCALPFSSFVKIVTEVRVVGYSQCVFGEVDIDCSTSAESYLFIDFLFWLILIQ